MSLQDCFRRGLLRKTKIEAEKIRNSLELAKHFLERADGNFRGEYFDVAFIVSYMSMFHTARALLFSRGHKERSHYCLIAFLKKEFGENKELVGFLDVLDSYRLSRHAIQYSGELCSEMDAKEAIADAAEFLNVVDKLELV